MQVNKLYICKKILNIFTYVIAGLISNHSLAFTLGDISLDSTLNQPLSADIELLELDGLDASQIIVTLGSEADFERVGVEPLPLLNELDFNVEVVSGSEGLIRISSADVIVEPYLNFVLNVRWPSGRVIREYTVLLDLPTFSANPTPIPAPTPARTIPAPTRPALPAPRIEPEPAMEEMPAAEPSSETVVIEDGDSLWNIALATRPGNDISVQQMMLAIQRANTNSDAFIGNNINGIRSGRVLRIPNRQEINAISQEQALTQVAVQNQQFSNNAQPLAVNNSQGGTNNTRDELSIVNNADDEAEISGLTATIANLEKDLMLSEENLDRALLENEELTSRLIDLEEEIAILENIVAIEGQRMAELQAELAEQAETAATGVLAEVAPQDSTSTPTQEPSPAPSGGIISNLLDSTLGMVAALVVLLALIVGFLIARNRSAAADEDEFDAILAEEENEPSPTAEAEESEVENSVEEAALGEDSFADDIDDDSESIQGISEDVDEEVAEEDDDESVKTGFLAGLLAKFSRKKDQDIDDEEDLTEEEDQSIDTLESESILDADKALNEDAVSDDDFEEFLKDVDIGPEDDEDDLSLDLDGLENADEDEGSLDPEGSLDVEDSLNAEGSLDAEDSSDAPENSSEEDNVDENIETFDFGDIALDDKAESENNNENSNSGESGESSSAESDLNNDTVFDLDDNNADDEIEFIDNDEDDAENKEEVTKTSSSLGNLGLDDAVAFDEGDEEELEIITDQDEVSTKLDLAVAYHAMDDLAGAKEILSEVIAEGNDAQIAEAQKLLSEWGGS